MDNRGAMSGAAMLLSTMLKPLGLNPEVIEQLSLGLLRDLKQTVKLQEENLARLEFLMRYTPALEGDPENLTCWEAYLVQRRKEIADLEAQANVRRAITNGHSDPGSAAS